MSSLDRLIFLCFQALNLIIKAHLFLIHHFLRSLKSILPHLSNPFSFSFPLGLLLFDQLFLLAQFPFQHLALLTLNAATFRVISQLGLQLVDLFLLGPHLYLIGLDDLEDVIVLGLQLGVFE